MKIMILLVGLALSQLAYAGAANMTIDDRYVSVFSALLGVIIAFQVAQWWTIEKISRNMSDALEELKSLNEKPAEIEDIANDIAEISEIVKKAAKAYNLDGAYEARQFSDFMSGRD